MFGKLRLRQQFFFIAILTIASFIGLLWFNYYQSAQMVKEKNEAGTRDVFQQIQKTVSGNYEVVKWLAYNLGYNRTVQDLLLADSVSLPNRRLETYQQINNLLINLTTVNSGILDLVITGDNGAAISLSSGIRDIQSFGAAVPEGKQPVFSEMKECFAGRQTEGSCLVAGTAVYSNVPYDRYTEKIGSIYVILDPGMLIGGTLGKSEEGSTTSLLDSAGRIMLSTDRTMVGQTLDIGSLKTDSTGLTRINGKLMHTQVGEIPEIRGSLVRYIPDSVFYHDVRDLRRRSLTAILLGLGLLSVPFFLILHNVISPLRLLYIYMKIRKPDDLNKAIVLRGSPEAEAIAKQFSQMLQQFKKLSAELFESKEKLLHEEIERKQAEYAYLKSQVNPHFLYNTLDSIRGIALERQVPEINEVTKALSQIFRYSVKGGDFVPFARELDIVSAYMQIQDIRFGGRFELRMDVEERFLTCLLPKMILQPLIENAVLHGMEPRSRLGLLTVSAEESGEGILTIRIKDNGVGMSDKDLGNLRSRLFAEKTEEPRKDQAGIGLRNVHNRLRHIYGSSFGLQIESAEEEGTEVRMCLPIQYGGEGECERR